MRSDRAAASQNAPEEPEDQDRGGRIRVAHIVHDQGIGGVEIAVDRLRHDLPPEVDYRVATLARPRDGAFGAPEAHGTGLNDPRSVLALVRWVRRTRPDVLVVSLWRSVIVGIIVRLLPGRPAVAVFLHATEYKNRLDGIAHRIGLRLADAVLTDSAATRDRFVTRVPRFGVQVVPLVTALTPSIRRPVAARDRSAVRLVFWGRLAREKRIDRAVDLVVELRRSVPVTLTLIGPDDGCRDLIIERATRLGVSDAIRLVGPVPWEELPAHAGDAAFFVQLSDFEGMAMAVIEAMSLGLVPVVTPVGEIPQYTREGETAIIWRDAPQCAREVLGLWTDEDRLEAASRAARATWVGAPSLADGFETAVRSIATARRHETASR